MWSEEGRIAKLVKVTVALIIRNENLIGLSVWYLVMNLFG